MFPETLNPSPRPCPYLDMCNVSFSSDQQKELASFIELKQPTHLINCEVKPSSQGDKLEITLKSFRKLPNPNHQNKTKNLTCRSTACRHSNPYSVAKVTLHSEFLPHIKVVYVNDPITVTGGKCKRTGHSHFSLHNHCMSYCLGNYIKTLDDSYSLTNMVVSHLETVNIKFCP